MRINVDDVALRDPDINRRLPRYTGLSRFDAFGRLIHVWGLAYDRRSAVLLVEDIDDLAEHDGFARAMVLAELADDVDDQRVRVRGVEERIGYLVRQAELGSKGGAKRAASGARDGAGHFARGALEATPSEPLDASQGTTKRTPSEPLDDDQANSKPTSGSGSTPSPAPDLKESRATPPATPAPLLLETPIVPKPDPAATASAELVGAINTLAGRTFDPASAVNVRLVRAFLRRFTVADGLTIIRAKAAEWLPVPSMAARVCPATLLGVDNATRYLDEIRAGPPTRASPPPIRGQVPISTTRHHDGDQPL